MKNQRHNFLKLTPNVKATIRGAAPLPKTATGIQGLDEITFGGLPKGRPTLDLRQRRLR